VLYFHLSFLIVSIDWEKVESESVKVCDVLSPEKLAEELQLSFPESPLKWEGVSSYINDLLQYRYFLS